MTLNQILKRVDESLKKFMVRKRKLLCKDLDVQLSIDMAKTAISFVEAGLDEFIHAEIKQAILDVLPEEEVDEDTDCEWSEGWNAFREEILNKLEE